jgi:threonine synthase
MRYVSTRGGAPELDFEDVLLTGLASDGGLYVPESLPQFAAEDLVAMAAGSYPELALRDAAALRRRDVSRLTSCAHRRRLLCGVPAPGGRTAGAARITRDWVLELFHGPTLAFKDFALQLLGRLLDAMLERRGEKVVIMGATSGDTGSAAIAGCQRCRNVDIFILHPHGRVSEVQRRQMTTVSGPRCTISRSRATSTTARPWSRRVFADQGFLPDGRRLVAVNSINWARIMAQIVYYFYAALALGAPQRPRPYSVPTGNFGDIFAGYLAARMGLPVSSA